MTKPDHGDGTRSVVIAGATGWAGSALARGVHAAPDLELVGAVSRSHAGSTLGDALDEDGLDTPVFASAAEALELRPDVFVEYTKPEAALGHGLAALDAGSHLVVGTSGLTADDFSQLDARARERERGALACGNFSLTAVLMMRFSAMAAEWIKSWEVLDYGGANKRDAPSGTARELATRLAAAGPPELGVPLDEIQGEVAARGADMDGTRVHSLRLPHMILGVETIFGLPDESLSIRHDAGSSATPYVGGALLAIRGVSALVGLHRGLDTVMDGSRQDPAAS